MMYIVNAVSKGRPDAFRPGHTSYTVHVRDELGNIYPIYHTQPTKEPAPRIGETLDGDLDQRFTKPRAYMVTPEGRSAVPQSYRHFDLDQSASPAHQAALKEAREQLRDLIELGVEKVKNGKEYLAKLHAIYRENIGLLRDKRKTT
jgi:hypothetical protein